MKPSELHELTEEELVLKEQQMKRNVFNLRFQLATNQQENTAALGRARRDVARVKTILAQRQAQREEKE